MDLHNIRLVIAILQSFVGFSLQTNNEILESYINSKITGYGSWLKLNRLDPLPNITQTLKLQSLDYGAISMFCEITNQSLEGHSNTATNVFDSESSFASHCVGLEHEMYRSLKFSGDFDCTGFIKQSYFADLKEDLWFSGKGNYSIKSAKCQELLIFHNVGIASEYDFNLINSYQNYEYSLTRSESLILLQGTWNVSQIEEVYLENVSAEYENLFGRVMKAPDSDHDKNVLKPTFVPVYQYFRKILEDLNLRHVLNNTDLPETYDPLPLPTTTTVTATSLLPTKMTTILDTSTVISETSTTEQSASTYHSINYNALLPCTVLVVLTLMCLKGK